MRRVIDMPYFAAHTPHHERMPPLAAAICRVIRPLPFAAAAMPRRFTVITRRRVIIADIAYAPSAIIL